MEEQDKGLRRAAKETYAGFIIGLWPNLMIWGWIVWQALWHQTQCKTVIIPEKAYVGLRNNIRDEVALAGKDQVAITTADVISALVFKTVFADSPSTSILQLYSVASVRRFSTSALPQDISTYPHNCITPLPYPLFSASALAALPLPALAAELASHRSKFTLEDAADYYRLVQTA